MGTGWRRAFCKTIPKDRETSSAEKQQEQSSPRSCGKLGFFSNPSTPRLQSQLVTPSPTLRCRTTTSSVQTSLNDTLISPKLRCKTASTKTSMLNPSSPRSPFSIIKNSLRLSRNSCGVCLQSVRRGQGMAIYTAECSHAFHFPCIASHVKNQNSLVCPVCNTTWKDVPLLAIHRVEQQDHPQPQPNTPKQEEIKNSPPPLTNLKIKPEPEPLNKNIKYNYSDDEPLLSPTTGGRFIPIPEEDENLEEIEEFQGFFVNPVSSSEKSPIDSRDVEVRVMPDVALVSVGTTHQAYAVVLKIKAPLPNNNASRRAPIDLVTVLDVGASMGGAKLQMLKRAMRLVISSLASADRLSIIAFSASSKRLLPLRRMTAQGQRAARRIIDRLVCSQGSCVGDALRKAAKVLEDRRERNPVASIMLLSDGQDEEVNINNRGQFQEPANVSSTRFAHIEIPVHAFGFGEKAGYTHEPAQDAFAKCVGGLLSVVVQDVRMQLGLTTESDPAEISAVYSCNGRPSVLGSSTIRLGDLYAEEERELLVELRVPTSGFASHNVLSLRCCYKDPATQEIVYGRERALLVPRAQAVRSSAPKIQRLRNLFITTRAIAESRRLVEHNELSSAQQLLSSAQALLTQSSSVLVDEYVRGLQTELAGIQWRRQYYYQQQQMMQRRRTNEREVGVIVDENGEPLTPTSAWRAAEQLAKVAIMKKSVNRVSDLHGFENARF